MTMLFALDRVERSGRTSDRVFDALVEAIRELELPPGRLLTESQLAEQLQVSRTPVREAIARLVDVGLVQVTPQVGTRVAKIRMTDVHEARFVRESLEVAAFEDACTAPGADGSTLLPILERQEAAHATGDLRRFFAADEEFHAEVFRLGGHQGAWSAVRRMKPQLDRLRRLSLPEKATTRALIDDHRLIAHALAAGNVPNGRAHVSAHARRALQDAPQLQQDHPTYFTSS